MNDDEMEAQMEYWKSKAKAAEAERDEAQLRAGINGLGAHPSEAGGPSKEEAYWQRRKLDAAIRHLRDIEDHFRLGAGTPESPNMIRADRARAIYEQISDDYLNGKTYRPTMKERAVAAEGERDRLREVLETSVGCWEEDARGWRDVLSYFNAQPDADRHNAKELIAAIEQRASTVAENANVARAALGEDA